MTTPAHILMCPPDYFGIEYEINPWMSRQRQADHEIGVRQWHGLVALLQATGSKISYLEPRRRLPDLVFTANAAIVGEKVTVLSRFRHPERQGEEPFHREWFVEHGHDVHELESKASFEGAGDALFCGDTLFAGYRIRSEIQAYEEIGDVLGCPVVPLELTNPRYYHLDTCFCPLAPGMAIYYPEAFDEYGRRALAEWIEDLIPVSAAEAPHFACNAVVVGRTVVTGVGCPALHAQLRDRGFTPFETPLDEFIKAGGSAKCLTLRLDGEEAAPWKRTTQVS